MSTAVRRATRQHRCARCGFTKTYQNAGATEARYWFSKHSCRKHEQKMVREHLADVREAAIDRTPKPCHHKEADHQHGTRAAYVLDRCRCRPCADANKEAESERIRLKAYGRYNKYVDAYPVRLHLQELKDYGIGLKQVSKVSGVSNGSLTKIWYGLYADTGRQAQRLTSGGELVRGPSRRVLRSTAERIYQVEPVPANLGPRQPDHERTPVARQHLQALVALGWSQSKLSARLNTLPANFGPIIGTTDRGGPRRRDGLRILSREMVDRIEALYTELSMTLPPEDRWHDKAAASRARSYAKARGWVPPLALDDDTDHSTPVEDDYIDDIAIERRMAGDRSIRLTTSETVELVRRWRASDRPLNECERITGINTRRYLDDAGAA